MHTPEKNGAFRLVDSRPGMSLYEMLQSIGDRHLADRTAFELAKDLYEDEEEIHFASYSFMDGQLGSLRLIAAGHYIETIEDYELRLEIVKDLSGQKETLASYSYCSLVNDEVAACEVEEAFAEETWKSDASGEFHRLLDDEHFKGHIGKYW